MNAPGADPHAAALAACVARVADVLRAQGAQMVSAESCTGGLVAGACTDLAGSSDWFERGVVTYSNQAKTELLGVPEALIAAHGAVSEPVARAMAHGALAHSPAHYAVAVTGIAGPGGGSADKPVGTVWFAWARRVADAAEAPGEARGARIDTWAERVRFDGNRAAVRRASVLRALEGLLRVIESRAP